MNLYELLQLSIPKTEGFWPSTGAGWVTLLGFFGSLIWIIFQSGRWSAKMEAHKKEVEQSLTGFGGRVTKMELGSKHEEGRVDALEVQLSRTQGQYEALMRILGEAKGSVDQFRVGMQASGEKIEKKIDDLRVEQGATKLEISQRLTAVETSLQHLENRSS